MGKLGTIGGLIGELADKVLDYLEETSDKKTEGIEEVKTIEGEVIKDEKE